MLENGRIVPAEHPRSGELFADDLLQYAPRRVRLGPGESQTVRILTRRPSGLATGEYRSHLVFRVEPPAEPRSGNGGSSDGLRIELTPVYGVSTPVIVHQGALRATASISDLELIRPAANKPTRVRFHLNRSGNRSLYGDVRVLFTPDDGEQRLLSRVRGLAVYTPNAARTVTLALRQEREGLPPGRLRVEYVDHDDTDTVLADAELRIP